MGAIPWVSTCSTGQTKKIRSKRDFLRAVIELLCKIFSSRKVLARNPLKNGRFVYNCADLRLWKTCASRVQHVLDLGTLFPCPAQFNRRQSRAVLRAAACRPTNPNKSRPGHRGMAPGTARNPEAEETTGVKLLSTAFTHLWK